MKRSALILVFLLLSISIFSVNIFSQSNLINAIDKSPWSNRNEGMNISLAAEASFLGRVKYRNLGRDVKTGGDVNGDGFSDILMGIEGLTYLIFGKQSGWTDNIHISNADASFLNEAMGDRAGTAIDFAGDVNGDGFDDIIIGALLNDESFEGAGQSYLILGKETGWRINTSLANADASFLGEVRLDNSGRSVAGVGDVNGDGYDDFMIGAHPLPGSVPFNVSQAYLILGKATGWSNNTPLSSADAKFIGEGLDDACGSSVAGAGDVNGDGFDDILIGARNNDGGGSRTGQTYLVMGRSSKWSHNVSLSDANASFWGEYDNDCTGYKLNVAGAGDVNGDGYDDILLGAWGNDENGESAGQAYLIFGKSTSWNMDTDLANADATFLGEYAGDYAGISVAGVGDLDGDGYDDFLIGADRNDDGGERSGKVYLFMGKPSGWSKDINLSLADSSFIGDFPGDELGESIAGGGDINGDGLDDFLLGSPGNDEGDTGAGKTYLITGSLIKEPKEVYSVKLYSDSSFSQLISIADVGEKIHVELLGLDSNITTQDTAVVNVTFKPGSLNLKRVFCMETGENTGIYRGTFIIPQGTIYFDTLNFSSRKDPFKFAHLFIDNPFRPTSISSMKTYYDQNYTIEVDKAGIGDILYIELIGNDVNPLTRNFALVNISSDITMPIPLPILVHETGINTGVYRKEYRIPETFIWLENIQLVSCRDPNFFSTINVDKPFRPTSIDYLKVFSDDAYSNEINKIQRQETIYMEIIGQDGNSLTRDFAFVNITSDKSIEIPIVILLRETEFNTGIYRGEFIIPNSNEKIENLTIISPKDSSKYANVMICTLVEIGPKDPLRVINEDSEYYVQYSNLGFADDPTWICEIDGDWLKFDTDTMILSGTPDNEDVGMISVFFNLSDDIGHFDFQEFNIMVNNTVPTMIGTDITEIYQGEYYKTDYNCDDDGQGGIIYYLTTTADWLEIDPKTGVLSGSPENDDVGTVTVQVSVHDGNGGWDSRQFDLIVHDVNDAPSIIVDDITQVIQDDPFVRNYVAEDIDVGDELRWKLHTNADFLLMNEETGRLTGTPTYRDVGSYFVNVSVWDLSDAYDFHNFTLEVLNINDPPIWVDPPGNVEVIHGQLFNFDANAIDHDGDDLIFSISSTPTSDIVIDEVTGIINWTADIHLFDSEPYLLNVKVSIFDGIAFSNETFSIRVLPTEPPIVDLVGPNNGMRSSSSATLLEWEGTDPEDETITYDIYLHLTEAFVQGLREEALYENEYQYDNITLSSLDQGKTYFWTVIPNDGCSFGECTSGVQSFRVNYRPTFKNIEDHQVPAGTDFKFKISCTDEDTEDLSNLRYSLIEAPDGMTISEDTGMIRWAPKDDQVMLHVVTVGVSDGIEMNTVTFEIEVTEGESSASTLIITVGIIVIVILLLALGIFFFIKQKKKVEEEALRKGEDERAALEKEREDEYASYEELYGVPAPEKDEEGLTTEELKEFIHEKIEELEGSE